MNNLISVNIKSTIPSLPYTLVNFCLVNSRSICNKSRIIQEMVRDSDFDMLALTETWLRGTEYDEYVVRDCCPVGYTLHHVPRLDTIGGGVGVIIKNIFKVTRQHLPSFKSFEHLVLLIKSATFLVRLAIVYRTGPVTPLFFDEFGEYLQILLASPELLLLVGDFNIHVDIKNDRTALQFVGLLETCNLIQHVNTATHRDGHILDLVITRADENFLSDFIVSQPGLSDHLAVQCRLNFFKQPQEVKRIVYRKLRSIDMKSFCSDLENSPLLTHSVSEISALVHQYNNILKSLLDRYAPEKSRTVRSRRTVPWFTDDIMKAKRKRRKMERRWRSSKSEIDHQRFTEQCIAVNALVKEAKETYYASVIDSNKGNQRTLFNCIDALLNKKCEPRYPSSTTEDNLAQLFINFFDDKIKILRESLPSVNTTIDFGNDVHPNCELLSFQPVTMNQVSILIKSKKLKCCALDPIPSTILKQCLPILLPVITNIVNLSLTSATVPDSLKIALLLPLLKKVSLDFEEFKNFRPVSNLTFISKVIEKTVASQLINYINDNALTEVFQSAYKKQHSTETALLRVHDDIMRAIDEHRSVVLLLLDLSAAFDTVDHGILLNRLTSCFGIKDGALAWFTSYLQKRHQFVSVNGHDSSQSELLYGLPQGSVLGPILYLLYTYPLGNIVRRHDMSFHFYADDSQIYLSFESTVPGVLIASKMEACIMDIGKWMAANKLMLNTDKTELLLIGSQFGPKFRISDVNVGNNRIVPSESARNIGVIFDSNMDYKRHISAICKSCFYHIRNLSRIRKYLSVDNIKILVHAFITCKLDNCNSLLYGLPSYLIHRLQLVQNCAARLIMCRNKFDHITPILKELHWIPVQQRIIFKILLITYKALNNLAPIYISNLLNKYDPVRQLRSSSQYLLDVPSSNLKSYGDRAFSVCAPRLWNDLPYEIKCSFSIDSFKSKLKTYLFRKAFY